MSLRSLIPITLAAGALTACSDFDAPAALPHPQILAVVAEPPVVEPGQRAELTILVAGPEGRMQGEVTWGAGVVTDDDGRAWLDMPVDAALGFVTVAVTVRVAGGRILTAEKSVGVGVPAANPVIRAVRFDGEAIDDMAAVHRDWLVELSADMEPAPTPDGSFAWYASVGELAYYRRSPAELTTPADAVRGEMFLVYRDGFGGVAWRQIQLLVE